MTVLAQGGSVTNGATPILYRCNFILLIQGEIPTKNGTDTILEYREMHKQTENQTSHIIAINACVNDSFYLFGNNTTTNS